MRLNFLYNKTPRFSFVDIYSISPNLKIKGKEHYSYLLSLCLSMISIISILIISIYFTIVLFERRSLSVILQSDSLDFPVVNLTEFPMTIHLYNVLGKSIKDQDRIYYITAKFLKYQIAFDENNLPYVNNTITDVKLEKCDLDKHFGQYKKYFLNSPDIDLKYCLPANSFNTTIFGKIGDFNTGFGFFQFFIHKCINGVGGRTNCYETEAINKILTAVQLAFDHLDYDANHNIAEDPRVLNIKTESFQVSSTVYKKINKYISPISYSTDYGYIFESLETIKFFQDEWHEVEQDLRKEGFLPGAFSSLTLICSYKSQKYRRLYPKIQNLLANIGGVIEGITVSMHILNYMFSRKLLHFVLFQLLFDNLEGPEKKNVKKRFEQILYQRKQGEYNLRMDSARSINFQTDKIDIKPFNSKPKIIR